MRPIEKVPAPGGAVLDQLDAVPAKSTLEHRLGGVERGRVTTAGGDHDAGAGTQHAGDLGEERGQCLPEL